jgi:hypothetical protein
MKRCKLNYFTNSVVGLQCSLKKSTLKKIPKFNVKETFKNPSKMAKMKNDIFAFEKKIF